MKRVLFIAPKCYPVTGAEEIVNIKLLVAMSKTGQFKIDLISKREKDRDYPSNKIEDLNIQLESLNVIEVDNKVNLKTIYQHIMCFLKFGVVYKGSHWAYAALNTAIKLCKENNYDYVLTKNSPSLLIGYYLKKHFNLKWVATWNDPYPDFTYPKIYADYFGAQKNWASKKEVKIMEKYVDVHIYPSMRLKQYMADYIDLTKSKTVIIPHVINNVEMPPIVNSEKKLRLIHSGNLKYPRNPRLFFEGLRMFLDSYDNPQIEVGILGVANNSLDEYLKEFKLEEYVLLLPPVSYEESLLEVRKYSVGLVIEAPCPEGIFLPTKVSDFMQLGMPIMAVSPTDGVLNDLYREGYINYIADNSSSESIMQAIKKCYQDFIEGRMAPSKIPMDYSEDSVINKYLSL